VDDPGVAISGDSNSSREFSLVRNVSGGRLEEIVTGVYRLATGKGAGTNVYLVRSGRSWVLIDTAWRSRAQLIRSAAETLFGVGARPEAIVLTHLHPDHAGSALELAQTWDVPVHVHPDELPVAPLGRFTGTLARAERRWMFPSGLDVLSGLDPSVGIPCLPEWRIIATPGHTPGHLSLFRDADRVLITGDAVLTVNLNSIRGALVQRHTVAGPPRISTWDWRKASESVAALARLQPSVLAPGHGRPMGPPAAASALSSLAECMSSTDHHRKAEASTGQKRTGGLLEPVDYSRRTRYRRPPDAYLRLQWLGPLLTARGIGPAYVVTLEVPGRRSGVIRRTTLVKTSCDGEDYLVALAGESEWVRNVRAAEGRVVIGRRERRAARLVEVPPEQRAPVIRAYLLRAGRRADSRTAAKEARSYFGLNPNPSLDEIGQIVQTTPSSRS
jgi:glyoxylase-like metal-dependent hydrolase (beta-lactamase superfamily II)